MRIILAIALAAVLLVPPFVVRASAAADSGLRTEVASDVSAARKKKPAKRTTAPKEQYMRAVPSTPPPGAKQ